MAAAEAPPPASSASPSLGIDWGIDLGAEAEAAAPSGGINWDFGGAAAEGPAATAAAAGIDWELGAMADSSAQGVGISWDIGGQEGGGSTAEAPAVDWGIDVGGGASAGAAAGDAGPAIDWGIDMSDIGASGATAAGINWDLSDVVSVPEPVASPSSSGGAIEGPAAVLLRLERDADYRAALLDDLQELRAFLLQVRGMQLRLCLLLFFVGYSPYWFQTCHAHSACTFMFKPSVLHLLPNPAAPNPLLCLSSLQRKSELRSSGTELLSALLPEAVQSVDAASVDGFLRAADAALAAATSERLRQLLMLKTSKRCACLRQIARWLTQAPVIGEWAEGLGFHFIVLKGHLPGSSWPCRQRTVPHGCSHMCMACRYFERMAGGLERKAGQEARLLAAAAEAETRKREARASLSALAPRLSEMVARTRRTKAETERSLAAVFGGRRVNILGEINSVLATAGL